MNQRVKELYEQAQDWADNQNFFASEYYDHMMEKFAELIARECGEVAFQQWCDNGEHESAQSAILNHFGVK